MHVLFIISFLFVLVRTKCPDYCSNCNENNGCPSAEPCTQIIPTAQTFMKNVINETYDNFLDINHDSHENSTVTSPFAFVLSRSRIDLNKIQQIRIIFHELTFLETLIGLNVSGISKVAGIFVSFLLVSALFITGCFHTAMRCLNALKRTRNRELKGGKSRRTFLASLRLCCQKCLFGKRSNAVSVYQNFPNVPTEFSDIELSSVIRSQSTSSAGHN